MTMNHEADFRDEFEMLIAQWEPKARRYLQHRGFAQEADDLLQTAYVAMLSYLAHGGPWPDIPEAYLWKVLRSVMHAAGNGRPERPMDDFPKPTSSPETGRVDDSEDLRFFLKCYARRHPKPAHALWVWIIENDFDAEAAARQLLQQEQGDLNDANRLYSLRRRLSAYLARFTSWVRHQFPDYPND
jgi:DNA-directed RNA polymerase specialized sigma24 family protein